MDINDTLTIDDALIEERFIRSSGPGGQNVNKVATAVQVRFPIDRCDALSDAVRVRLRDLAGSRVNSDGELVLTASRHRSQRRNRDDARERLARLIERALYVPPPRKKRRGPSAAQKRRRLADKRQRSERKKMRGRPALD